MRAISFRIEHKGAGRAGFQRRHDMRQGHQPQYVDAARRELNSVIIAPATPGELRRICEERVAAQEGRQRAMKSNAAIATHGILTFGREAQAIIEELPREEQDRRILESCRAAAAEMGVELTGLVVHRDEEAIHAHCQMPARMPDGRPISKVVDCKRLQDVAAEAWADLGITRGKPKTERVADGEPYHAWRHRTVKQLHEDLPRELEGLEARRDALQADVTKNAARAQKVRSELEAASGDAERAAKLRKRLEAYERRLEAKRAELDALEASSAKGGRVAAFFGGLTGWARRQREQVATATKRAEEAGKVARKSSAELERERRRYREAKGQADARGQQLEAAKGQLERYREAARGLSPDALERVVTRGLSRVGPGHDRDADLER